MSDDWITTDGGHLHVAFSATSYWSEADARRDYDGHTRQANLDDLRWVREVH
jgi:hypothetical protein